MSKEKIESRRAFMKKFGKLAGAAAVAAPFMAMAAKEAVAAPDEDNPVTSCNSCSGACLGFCTGTCFTTCRGECDSSCKYSCWTGCNMTCAGKCDSSSTKYY